MLNLLIREDRHWLRKEYLMRFSLVFLFFIIFSLVTWGIVITSFYIQLRVEESTVKTTLEDIKNSSDVKNSNELIDLNKEIDRKLSEIKIFNFKQEDLLREIVISNQEGISISLISSGIMENEEKGFYANLEIRGVANNRATLVSYQESLESSEMFEEVKIPFSSFAQNSDIPFSVNVKTVELNEYFENEN